MTTTCGCRPGTEANGWHEQRCAACQEAEMEQWRQMLARLRGQDVSPAPPTALPE